MVNTTVTMTTTLVYWITLISINNINITTIIVYLENQQQQQHLPH